MTMSPETPQIARELYCPMCERAFASGEVCPTDGERLVSLVAQRDPFVGRDLDGRYLVAEKLGQGGMGAVYRGTQTSVGREVAIKVVNPAMIGEPEVIKRFLREAKLASKLNHPHAVAVVDFGQTRDGVFYLVMELIKGRTLAELLLADKRLVPERAIAIGTQILSALEGAHAMPIVHRDLKPANIMVGADDYVKVLDFGIAKSIAPDTIGTTMTNAGSLLGTPHFMPPEIAHGGAFDGRADLYSLGCILFFAVEGRLPFNADTLPELLHQHMFMPVPPMKHAPPGLVRVIETLLAKEPAGRYATATIARDALANALVSTDVTTIEDLPKTSPQVRPVRKRWPMVTAAIVAVSVGVVTAIVVASSGPSAIPTPAPAPAPPPIPTAAPTPTATPIAIPSPPPPPTPAVVAPVPADPVPPPVPAPVSATSHPPPAHPVHPAPTHVTKPAAKPPVHPPPRPPDTGDAPPPF